jgi:hypothetical protein
MKSYLVITGLLFAALGVMHVGNAVLHFHGNAEGAAFYAENLGLGGIAAALGVWGLFLSSRA